jgi:hypothetical protein
MAIASKRAGVVRRSKRQTRRLYTTTSMAVLRTPTRLKRSNCRRVVHSERWADWAALGDVVAVGALGGSSISAEVRACIVCIVVLMIRVLIMVVKVRGSGPAVIELPSTHVQDGAIR